MDTRKQLLSVILCWWQAPSTLLKVALVLALGVCYRAGLRSKQKFDQYIVQQVPDFLDHAEQFGLILEE